MKKYLDYGFLIVLIMGTFLSCSDNSSGITDDSGVTDDDGVPLTFDRSAMLENWADNIILPSYVTLSEDLALLRSAFQSFSSDPSEASLGKLREQWLQAYITWQTASIFEIGPAESVGLRLQLNTYPVDVAKIEAHVTSGEYDLSLPSNRDTKGFAAMDYLINGLETNDIQIVDRYRSGVQKEAYLQYLDALCTDMEAHVAQVFGDWQQGYRDTFVDNDGSSATASVDRFVNDYIFHYEKFLRAGKMGIPLGVFTGSVAPQTIEAYYRPEVSKQLFLAGLDAVQDFFNGKHYNANRNGESLASYLRTLNTLKEGEDLDILINAQLDLAREKVSSLTTFREEIENNNPPTQMLLAYDEVQRVVPLLKVDMVSAMSISIDFVDADGD